MLAQFVGSDPSSGTLLFLEVFASFLQPIPNFPALRLAGILVVVLAHVEAMESGKRKREDESEDEPLRALPVLPPLRQCQVSHTLPTALLPARSSSPQVGSHPRSRSLAGLPSLIERCGDGDDV